MANEQYKVILSYDPRQEEAQPASAASTDLSADIPAGFPSTVPTYINWPTSGAAAPPRDIIRRHTLAGLESRSARYTSLIYFSVALALGATWILMTTPLSEGAHLAIVELPALFLFLVAALTLTPTFRRIGKIHKLAISALAISPALLYCARLLDHDTSYPFLVGLFFVWPFSSCIAIHNILRTAPRTLDYVGAYCITATLILNLGLYFDLCPMLNDIEPLHSFLMFRWAFICLYVGVFMVKIFVATVRKHRNAALVFVQRLRKRSDLRLRPMMRKSSPHRPGAHLAKYLLYIYCAWVLVTRNLKSFAIKLSRELVKEAFSLFDLRLATVTRVNLLWVILLSVTPFLLILNNLWTSYFQAQAWSKDKLGMSCALILSYIILAMVSYVVLLSADMKRRVAFRRHGIWKANRLLIRHCQLHNGEVWLFYFKAIVIAAGILDIALLIVSRNLSCFGPLLFFGLFIIVLYGGKGYAIVFQEITRRHPTKVKR